MVPRDTSRGWISGIMASRLAFWYSEILQPIIAAAYGNTLARGRIVLAVVTPNPARQRFQPVEDLLLEARQAIALLQFTVERVPRTEPRRARRKPSIRMKR